MGAPAATPRSYSSNDAVGQKAPRPRKGHVHDATPPRHRATAMRAFRPAASPAGIASLRAPARAARSRPLAPRRTAPRAMAAPSSATAPDGVLLGANTVDLVQQYYGETLATSADLKTSACCAAGAPPPHIRDILRRIPSPVTDKFYGCGAPLPLGMEGLRVLDLGWCVWSPLVSAAFFFCCADAARRAAARAATATWRQRWWARAAA